MFNLAELKKVLEPFARQLEHWGDSRKSDHHRPPDSALPQISERLWNNMQTWGAPTVAAFSYGDLRAAADFLARLQDEGVPEGEADWSVDDSRLAERIMSYLGVSTRSEGSYEPGASPMRDHVAAMLAARPTPSGDGWKPTDRQRFLLEWLSKEDTSAYGECHGSDLDVLVSKGLAVVGPTPVNHTKDYARVSLTEAGWAMLPSPPSGDSPEEIARVADEFAKLAGKATAGPWSSDTERRDGSYGIGDDEHVGFDSYVVFADEVLSYGKPARICDVSNSDVAEVHQDFDEDGHYAWDEQGRCDAAFIAFCGTHRALILDGLRALTTARSEGRTEATGEIVRLKTTLTEAVASLNAKANRHRDAMKEIAAIPQEDSSERDAAEHDCHQAAADALGAAISVITQAVYPPAEEIAF